MAIPDVAIWQYQKPYFIRSLHMILLCTGECWPVLCDDEQLDDDDDDDDEHQHAQESANQYV